MNGIHAQGLQVLKEALEPLCELWVVAPSSQQSATSRSLIPDTILRRRQAPFVWVQITGRWL
ncbi:MAG: hypothetical protein GY835_20375 [bacterium]|nr:hypothetical protein [bacterium]